MEPNPVDVLLVDDHDLLAESLALTIRSEGFAVGRGRGATVDETIELARAASPRVVLLDLDLGPELGSGADLIPAMKETGAQVVMLTGVTDRVELARCVEAGADALTSKADSFEAVLAVVRRALEGDEVMRPDEREALLAELREARRSEEARLGPFAALTDREQRVLGCMMAGQKAETMAEELFVSLATIRTHVRSVLQKLGVNSQLAAVVMAERAGWRPPEP